MGEALRGEMRQELSPREREVLKLVEAGFGNPYIARELGISRWTVRLHLKHIRDCQGAPTRTAAMIHALQSRRRGTNTTGGRDGS